MQSVSGTIRICGHRSFVTVCPNPATFITSRLLLRPVRDPLTRCLSFCALKHASRPFSLTSLFSRVGSARTPSPLVVAHISRLEAEANVHPHDVPKQIALFQALADTKLRSSFELIISRWERMCEFDNSSPLLWSAIAFQHYLSALLHTEQKLSIQSAVRRRDSLLAEYPQFPISHASPNPTISPFFSAEASSKLDFEAISQSDRQIKAPQSSHKIAEAVLASDSNCLSSTQPSTSQLLRIRAKAAEAQEAPIQVSIVERKGAWIPRTIRFLTLLSVSAFFLLVILSVFFENTGFMKAGPRQNQFENTNGKTIKFTDIHGVDEAKEELQDVVLFLKDPTTFASLGGKLPKGVLLTGPPGTGKTLLARAVAGEAGVPFFFASGSDFEEMFVGLGAKRVRELFAAARKKQPAIIFIDELDAVGGKRSNRDQQYLKQTLNQLLVEMDGFQQSEGVIVIAATNFPESLDQALVRPGRFDKAIAVPLPDVRGRIQILQHHMQNVVTGHDIDTKVLARGTVGFSGADLQNMVNLAAIQASKEKADHVSLKHFDWAKDRIIMGTERKSQYVDQDAKLTTAYHEGGHVLVALYTDGAMPLHKVTCVPRGHTLGFTSLLPEDDRYSVSLKQYLAGIDVSMGGRVAEELIYGPENVTSGASSDLQSATHTARSMVKRWGFSKLGPVYYGDRDESLSSRRREEIEEEITKILKESEARAATLLISKLDELHRLAHALVEHETLDSEEVQKVINGQPIRNISEVLDEELSNLEHKDSF